MGIKTKRLVLDNLFCYFLMDINLGFMRNKPIEYFTEKGDKENG